MSDKEGWMMSDKDGKQKHGCCQQFPLLSTAAQKLLSAYVRQQRLQSAIGRNWSAWRRTYTDLCSCLSIDI